MSTQSKIKIRKFKPVKLAIVVTDGNRITKKIYLDDPRVSYCRAFNDFPMKTKAYPAEAVSKNK